MDIVGYTRRSLTIVCIFFLLSSMTISSAFSTAGHGCAPDSPPPVAGTLVQPPATPHIVFINEVLSNPGSVWNCSGEGTKSADKEAWVELYNPQNEALDLYAVHSSLDSGPNTTRSYLPVGAAIAAHGFLVIFPPVSIFAQLSSSAGSSLLRLLLTDTVVDQVTLIPLVSDTSYARMPDGGDTWQVTDTPTIDASNVPLTPTPKLTHTPKPSQAKMSSQKTSSKGSKSTGSTDNGALTDTGSEPEGTQPAWNTLSIPTPPSSDSQATTQGNAANSARQGTNTGDLPRKVLLTSLAAASLLALLWASRFFTRAKKLPENSAEAAIIQEKDSFSERTVNIPIMSDDHPLQE